MSRDRMFMEENLAEFEFDLAMLDGSDDDLLELLCEDGFLEPDEVAQAETPEDQEALIRLAIARGFLQVWDEACIETAVRLIVRKLDSLRIWKDLTHEDFHLRAPPEVYAKERRYIN